MCQMDCVSASAEVHFTRTVSSLMGSLVYIRLYIIWCLAVFSLEENRCAYWLLVLGIT